MENNLSTLQIIWNLEKIAAWTKQKIYFLYSEMTGFIEQINEGLQHSDKMDKRVDIKNIEDISKSQSSIETENTEFATGSVQTVSYSSAMISTKKDKHRPSTSLCLVHHLLQVWEPQLSRNYRPSADTANIPDKDTMNTGKKDKRSKSRKFRTTVTVVSAVSRMQKGHNTGIK